MDEHETQRWQQHADPCIRWPGCRGSVNYELTCQGPWELKSTSAVCSKCGQAHSLELLLDVPGGARVRRRLSGPRYHVTGYPPDGGLFNDEFVAYCDVLSQLGHSTEREMTREPQSDGNVHLRGGRLGIVNTKEEADAILKALKARMPNIPWHVEEVPQR